MSLRDQIAAILRRPTVCMQAHEHARLLLRIEERRMRREQPIVAGGQGRTARQVRESANTLAGLLIVGAFCVLALALCSGGA